MSSAARRSSALLAAITAIVALGGQAPSAQSLGSFRWQLQPFCNVLTLSIRQDGAIFTLDGTDDRCGAAQQAAVVGTAFFNPDGTLGMGLTSMGGPNAAPVVLHAQVSLATVSGTWADSAGNTGTFAFTPGPGSGGAPRPLPSNGIRPGSITATQLAPGAVGAAQIAPGTITAAQLADGSITAAKLAPGSVQAPIAATCPVGQYLRGFSATGTVVCEAVSVPPTALIADAPLSVGLLASMAIGGDGLPIVVHRNASSNRLRVTHCGNPSCTAGNESLDIGPTLPINVEVHGSVAIGLDGRPVIAHYDDATTSMVVTRCGTSDCTVGNITTIADDPPLNIVGRWTAIAVPADGLPVIALSNTTAARVRVVKCGNAGCTAGNTAITIDSSSAGARPSLAIGADGLPVVAYENTGVLRVTKCGNAACTAGNVSTTVDSVQGQTLGQVPTVVIGANGNPVITHVNPSADTLRITHCGNPSCTAVNASRTLANAAGSSGYAGSVAIGADGLPIATAIDSANGRLRAIKCGAADCSGSNGVAPLADDATSFNIAVVAIGRDGLPVVAYRTPQGLGVVRCNSQTCR